MVRAQLVERKQRTVTWTITTRRVKLESAEAELHERPLEQLQPILAPARINSSKHLESSLVTAKHVAMLEKRLFNREPAVFKSIRKIRDQQDRLADASLVHLGDQGIAQGILHLAHEQGRELFR